MTDEKIKQKVIDTCNQWRKYFSKEHQDKLKKFEQECIDNEPLHIGFRDA